MKFDPAIAAFLLEVGRAIWSAFSSRDDGERNAEAIARAAIDAMLLEARRRAEVLGIEVSLETLHQAIKGIVGAMQTPPNPKVGLGVILSQVEVVPEITDEDRERERKAFEELRKPEAVGETKPETWDDIETPPPKPPEDK